MIDVNAAPVAVAVAIYAVISAWARWVKTLRGQT